MKSVLSDHITKWAMQSKPHSPVTTKPPRKRSNTNSITYFFIFTKDKFTISKYHIDNVLFCDIVKLDI